MDNASWLALTPDAPALALAEDIRARDVFGGRDCGWVGQMQPFIRHYSRVGQRVLDPFCGLGTTLLAAGLETRCGIGFEIDPHRAALARERLQRHGVQADIQTGQISPQALESPVDLCLTNVPYFGCAWSGAHAEDQLYLQQTYTAFLSKLRGVFHTVRRSLKEGGFCVAMAENIVINGRRFALAWDLARILDSLFVAHEERVLCYPERAPDYSREAGQTTRAHEYALVYEKRREVVDLTGTQAVLEAIAQGGFEYELFGSFKAWREAGSPGGGLLPADADLVLPPHQDRLDALLRWLCDQGFELSLWGEPVAPRIDLKTWRTHHYVRADLRRNDGSLIRLDLCCGG